MSEGQNLPNEELEVTPQPNETDSTPESDTPSEDTITLTQAELDEKLKERAKKQDERWKERLKDFQGDKETPATPEEPQKDDLAAIKKQLATVSMAAQGITDPDIQEFITDEAARLQKEPGELLNDEYYKAKIAEKTRDKENAAATPNTSTRSVASPAEQTTAQLLANAEKGIMPETKEDRKRLRNAMLGR